MPPFSDPRDRSRDRRPAPRAPAPAPPVVITKRSAPPPPPAPTRAVALPAASPAPKPEAPAKPAKKPRRGPTPPKPPRPFVTSSKQITQFFAWRHLGDREQRIAKPFAELAYWIVRHMPHNPERMVALRKLLESRDAAMRVLLYRHPDHWDRRELIPDAPPELGELVDEPDEGAEGAEGEELSAPGPEASEM